MTKVRFIILGGGSREVEVEEGTTVEKAAEAAGLSLRGYSLRVRVPEDVAEPTSVVNGPVAFVTLEPNSAVPAGSSVDVVAAPKVEAG